MAPPVLIVGQRANLKPAGLVPAGVFETTQATLPPTANAVTAFYSRAGMPLSTVFIDHFVSFDGGATWEYAGGFETVGGPYRHRNGQITTENSLFVPNIPAERGGRPRFFFSRITTTDPHDIVVDLRPDQVDARAVIGNILAGMS